MSEQGREIDSRVNDGMMVTWLLQADGTHSILVDDSKKGTFDVLRPTPEEAGKYFQHPQMYIGETAVPPNVMLGEE